MSINNILLSIFTFLVDLIKYCALRLDVLGLERCFDIICMEYVLLLSIMKRLAFLVNRTCFSFYAALIQRHGTYWIEVGFKLSKTGFSKWICLIKLYHPQYFFLIVVGTAGALAVIAVIGVSPIHPSRVQKPPSFAPKLMKPYNHVS